jgi:hypothetical protein
MPRENAFVNAFSEGKQRCTAGKMSVRTNLNPVRMPSGCCSIESMLLSPHNPNALPAAAGSAIRRRKSRNKSMT